MSRLLVVAQPRSGTKYTAIVFSKLGVRSTHEEIFDPESPFKFPVMWPHDLKCESSWLAVPYLDRLPRGIVPVYQVRDPLNVLRSMLKIKFLIRGTIYDQFAYYHVPAIRDAETVLDKVITFYLAWHRLALQKGWGTQSVMPQLKAESFDPGLVSSLCAVTGVRVSRARVEEVLWQLPKNVNHKLTLRPGKLDMSGLGLTWEEVISRPGGDEVRALAESFGYDTTGAQHGDPEARGAENQVGGQAPYLVAGP